MENCLANVNFALFFSGHPEAWDWWWPAWDHNKWMREWAWVKHKKLLLHKNDLAVQNWLCWVYCAITTGRLQDERQNESALLDCKKLVTSIL